MARKLRLEYAGACYHVINRGNYRRNVFEGEGAAASFQACLFEALAKFGWRLHAFVIMRNHFHLAVETPEPNLSEGMRWLQATWAARFNRWRGETGRPFQGRYKALHVEPGHALAQVAHYIHLNPVRAKIVTAEHLLDYAWSSLPWFLKRKCPAGLEGRTVLAQSGELAATAAGWRRYVAYLGVLAEEDAQRRDAKFGRLSRGWMIGSAGFKAELKRSLEQTGATEERFELLGADGAAHREVRTLLWEEKLQQAARTLGIDLEQLDPQRSAVDKVALAAVMKTTTAVTNRWLAERLHMGEPASVSQYVGRFRQRGEMEKEPFKAAVSKVNP